MFERFTDRARRVVVLAQEQARLLNHNYIGTEHLLLGLIAEEEGVAAIALAELGIDLAAVRAQVEEIIGMGTAAPTGHIPFTPRAKKVLELSLREALQLGHNYIGTEHILLGVIREGEGVAAQVLQKMGAILPLVRSEVMKLLGEPEEVGKRRGRRRPRRGLRSMEVGPGLGPIEPPMARRFDGDAWEALEKALAVSTWLDHEEIEASDVLWGLIRGGHPDVIRNMEDLGMNLERARSRLTEIMAGAAEEEPVEEGSASGEPVSEEVSMELDVELRPEEAETDQPDGSEGRTEQQEEG